MTAAPSTSDQRLRVEALVDEAEQLLQSSPMAHTRELMRLALLGYGVIVRRLFLLGAFVAGNVTAAIASTAFMLLLFKNKLLIILVIVIWVLVKALWVKLERPGGFAITAQLAPQLFDDLDTMRQRLALAPIHQVLLTTRFNAAAVQTPRLGIFGWQFNTIELGLALLLAMARDEARAVLARELGSLSAIHSRFAGWNYRVRMRWIRNMEAVDQSDGIADGGLRRFFDWYPPYFHAQLEFPDATLIVALGGDGKALARWVKKAGDQVAQANAGSARSRHLWRSAGTQSPNCVAACAKTYPAPSSRRASNDGRNGKSVAPGFAPASVSMAWT